jgi:hypothetical protein
MSLPRNLQHHLSRNQRDMSPFCNSHVARAIPATARSHVMRRRYYNGRRWWHEDRYAKRRSSIPMKWAVITLMILAGLVVLASIIP